MTVAMTGGHLTDTSTETVYSGVLLLRFIHLVVFLADINALQLWGVDVGTIQRMIVQMN
jgi:hypothetical protein